MIIGVMSDTHRNMDLMNDAAALMVDTFGATAIYHLGDDHEDSAALANRGVQLVRIPGTYDKEYGDPDIPQRVTENVAGVTILAAHAEKTIPQNEFEAATIVLVGHTHLHEIRPTANGIVFNPGHLKSASEKGREPTFGIIEVDQHSIRLAIYDLNGEPVETHEVGR
jgi:putative phosphoesterase